MILERGSVNQSDFRYREREEVLPLDSWIRNDNNYNLYVFFKGYSRPVFLPPRTALLWQGDYIAEKCEHHAKDFMVAYNYSDFMMKNEPKKINCTCGSESIYGDVGLHADYCDKYKE